MWLKNTNVLSSKYKIYSIFSHCAAVRALKIKSIQFQYLYFMLCACGSFLFVCLFTFHICDKSTNRHKMFTCLCHGMSGFVCAKFNFDLWVFRRNVDFSFWLHSTKLENRITKNAIVLCLICHIKQLTIPWTLTIANDFFHWIMFNWTHFYWPNMWIMKNHIIMEHLWCFTKQDIGKKRSMGNCCSNDEHSNLFQLKESETPEWITLDTLLIYKHAEACNSNHKIRNKSSQVAMRHRKKICLKKKMDE